jgi:hypothetical protein
MIGKNVDKNLRNVLSEVVSLGSMFKGYNVLFIDGNSTDGTKKIFYEILTWSWNLMYNSDIKRR